MRTPCSWVRYPKEIFYKVHIILDYSPLWIYTHTHDVFLSKIAFLFDVKLRLCPLTTQLQIQLKYDAKKELG